MHSTCAAVSPAGATLCVATVEQNGHGLQRGIDFIKLVPVCLLQRQQLAFRPSSVSWAADGASVLVTDKTGCRHLLLDFESRRGW